MDTAKTIAAVVLGLLGAAALCVIVYLASWWLRGDAKDREVAITNKNTGVQTAWRDEALEHIAEIEVLKNSPQSAAAQAALADRACDLIGRLTDSYRNDPRIVAFNESECL